MKPRVFWSNISGLSLLYDAVLFVIMVSLAGVVLIPALQSNIAIETSIESHRELRADEALQTYLISRADSFDYRVCGDIIDTVAERIGIENRSNGLYQSLTSWILGHEQLHKSYATLLAEDLGCQFRLPLSVLGTNRLNIFTTEFTRRLTNETNLFFSNMLHDKYKFNLTAWWHPMKGIPFGAEFYVGETPPTTDCYVAHSQCIMPFTPVVKIRNQTITLTKHWLHHQLFSNATGWGESSIPAVANITRTLVMYTNKQVPFNTRENATQAVQENLSVLTYGFLVAGLKNETNGTVFPGIVNMSLSYGFERIKNITGGFFEDTLNEAFGEAIRVIDRFFSGVNGTLNNPLFQEILYNLNATLHRFCNGSFPSLSDVLETCERIIKENVTVLLKNILDPCIAAFVQNIFDMIDKITDFAEMLEDWLFDRISITTAEVTLTIWAVRE